MEKNYNTKIYLEKLSEEQMKELIILGLIECDSDDNQDYLRKCNSLEDISIQPTPREDWNEGDRIFVQTHVGSQIPYIPYFTINDFSMVIHDGIWKKNLDEVLHIYLASQFGEEYVNYLFSSRVAEAEKEKEHLTTDASKTFAKMKDSCNLL